VPACFWYTFSRVTGLAWGVKILIADDHPLYRQAVAIQIQRLYEDAQVTEVSSFDALRDKLTPSTEVYDLVLVDYHMPGMSSQALIDLVRDHPSVPVALISGTAPHADVRTAIQAGVKGYIPKTVSHEYFASSLRMLLSGGSSIPAEILVTQSEAGSQSWLLKLSQRERDVMQGIVLGRSNKEIGRTLGLAEVTIKLHLRNLFRKMSVKTRAEAAVKAVRAGFV
jgi:two-component system, NarL family, nitrate/nitrite response regulator NarL